jgi:single-strand DNA-binding protein
MAGSYCKVILVGNLGGDPELRYTPDGRPVVSFNVAVNRRRRQGEDSWVDETDWFRVTAWEKLAETCNQYLSKGRKVLVEGRLQTRTFQGADGQTRKYIDVIASQVVLLDRAPAAEPVVEEETIEAEDLPF